MLEGVELHGTTSDLNPRIIALALGFPAQVHVLSLKEQKHFKNIHIREWDPSRIESCSKGCDKNRDLECRSHCQGRDTPCSSQRPFLGWGKLSFETLQSSFQLALSHWHSYKGQKRKAHICPFILWTLRFLEFRSYRLIIRLHYNRTVVQICWALTVAVADLHGMRQWQCF